jgi:hypothetical protein
VISRNGARARPKRSFVRRKLEHALDPRGRAPARHVGTDRKHAGPRLWAQKWGH